MEAANRVGRIIGLLIIIQMVGSAVVNGFLLLSLWLIAKGFRGDASMRDAGHPDARDEQRWSELFA